MIVARKSGRPVVGDLASLALIGPTLLSVGLIFSSTAAYAQQPNPPVLFGAAPVSPVSGNIIFKETFEGMSLGDFEKVPGTWVRGLTSNGNGTAVTIQDNNPVSAGFGNYYRAYAKKFNDSIYRTEIYYVGTPRFTELTSVGGGHYVGQDYWYGHVWCLDKMTPGAGKVHLNQLHVEQEEVAIGHSPEVSITVDSTELELYIEHQHEPGTPSNYTKQLFQNPVGKCFDIIMNIKRDSRLAADGSTGKVQVWLDLHGVNNPTAKVTLTNRQVGHPYVGPAGPGGGTTQGYFHIGGYESSWRWSGTNGDEYEARYDNFTVMDSTGSYAAMAAALNRP